LQNKSSRKSGFILSIIAGLCLLCYVSGMETIPLRPVFENEEFNTLNPTLQFFIIKAVYLLCSQGKADNPLPANLRCYLQCSESAYVKHIDVFRNILANVLPQIAKIKQHACRQTKNATTARMKKRAERRLERSGNNVFSDAKDTHVLVIAVPSPPKIYGQGKFDHVARSQAIKNNKPTDKETWFKDK